MLHLQTLGIGNSASTAMVEGLARVGNGVASFVSDGEAFTGKANRLLKAARSPLVTNIRLDWGADIAAALAKERELLEAFEIVPDTSNVFSIPVDTTPISLFDPAVDALNSTPTPLPNPPPIILRPSPLLQQFPSTISGISPANRLYVYTLLALPATSLPSHVTLKGDLASGASVELQIPITRSQLPKSVAIHTLAARKLIQDLEDGALGREDASDITKAKIVRLGTTYSLASTYTSLVAVDESESSTGKRLGPARPCSTVASDSTRWSARAAAYKRGRMASTKVRRSRRGRSRASATCSRRSGRWRRSSAEVEAGLRESFSSFPAQVLRTKSKADSIAGLIDAPTPPPPTSAHRVTVAPPRRRRRALLRNLRCLRKATQRLLLLLPRLPLSTHSYAFNPSTAPSLPLQSRSAVSRPPPLSRPWAPSSVRRSPRCGTSRRSLLRTMMHGREFGKRRRRSACALLGKWSSRR